MTNHESPVLSSRIGRLVRICLLGLLGLLAAAGLTVAALSLFGPSASANPTCNATFTNGAGDNEWTTAGNWSPATVPNSSSTVVCMSSGASVIFDPSSATMTVEDIEGSGASLVVRSGQLNVVDTTPADSSNLGTLEVRNGTANISGNLTVATATVDGGTLQGSGAVSATNLAWSAGNLDGGGGSITVSGATTITTDQQDQNATLSSYTLNANGGAQMESTGYDPGFFVSYAGAVNLSGTSTMGAGYYVGNTGGSDGLTLNTGAILDPSSTAGSTDSIVTPFAGDGTINVPTATTLDVAGGGTSTGTFNLAGTAALELSGVTLSSAGTIAGTGGDAGNTSVEATNSTINGSVTAGSLATDGGSGATFTDGIDVGSLTVSNATYNFNGPSATYTVTGATTVDGGTLGGSGTIATGSLAWSSGNISGNAGTIDVTGLTSITTSGASDPWYITNEAIDAEGGANFVGTGVENPGFTMSYQSSFQLGATSTMSGGYYIATSGSSGITVSPGVTLTVTGPAGSLTNVFAPFADNGTVKVPSGATFAIVGGGTSTGTFDVPANGTLNLENDTLSATAVVSGTGGDAGSTTLEAANSTINGSVTVGTLETEGGSNSTFNGGIDVGTLTVSNASYSFNGSSVTYTVVGALTVNGGTLQGSGAITTGSFAWSSGNISGNAGAVTVTGSTSITTSGDAEQWYIGNEAINAESGVTFGGAGINDPEFTMSYQSSIVLAGPSTIPAGYYIGNSGSIGLTIAHGGTLTETGASGSNVTISAPVTDNGTVSVPAGAQLLVEGGGTSSGAFNIAAGGNLQLTGVTLSATASVNGTGGDTGTASVGVTNSTINGAITAGTLETIGGSNSTFAGGFDVGSLVISNSTFSLNGTSVTYNVAGTLTLDGGTLGGSGDPTVASLDWTSGNIAGNSGTLAVTGTTTFATSGSIENWNLGGETIDAEGTTTFQSSGIDDPQLVMGYSGSIVLAGASTIQPGYVLANTGSIGLTIAHGTTLTDSGSSGSSVSVNCPMSDNGTVVVPAGAQLSADGGGTSTGSFTVAAGATLALGNMTLSSTGSVSGAGGDSGTATVEFWNSTINGSVTAGTLETDGGSTTTFSDGFDVGTLDAPNSTFNLSGTTVTYNVAGAFNLDGGTVGGNAQLDTATFNWSEGYLNGSPGSLDVSGLSTISTLGTVDQWSTSDEVLNLDGGLTVLSPNGAGAFTLGYGVTFNISGTSTIPGSESITSSYLPTINVQGGTLTIGGASGSDVLNTNVTNNGTITLPAGADVIVSGTFTAETGSTTTLAAASSTLSPSSVIVSGGTLQGSGFIGSSVSNTAGTVQGGVATTPGALTIIGSYTQGSGGTLVANLAGATPGSGYSQVNATSASINGVLNVDDRASFAPNAADVFAVLNTLGSLTGTFATVNATGFAIAPATSYLSNQVDLNFDVMVNPTVSLHTSASPVVYGNTVTFTSTVTGGSTIATGTVQFKNGTASLGSPQPLSNGVATYTSASLPVGTLSITAVYSGDSNYNPGTSSPVSQSVTKASTTMSFAPSSPSAGAGQTVSLIASITAKNTPATATGSVTFYEGSKKLGSASLVNGVATLKKSFTKGTYALKAVYKGTSDFASSSGTSSLKVLSAGSTTTLKESASRVLTNTKVKLTAKVAAAAGSTAPTGTVTFYSNQKALGKAVTLSSKDQASASYNFGAAGTYSITASYSGSSSFGGSSSSALSLVVQQPGYRMAGEDGGVFDFGGAGYYGSLPHSGIVPATNVIGITNTPDGLGYWLVTQGGVVYPFGDAKKYSEVGSGSPSGVVALISTADGKGYWLVDSNGDVIRYGDAAEIGSKSGITVIDAVGTPDAKGYWMTTTGGRVYPFGDAATEKAVSGQASVTGTVSRMSATIDGKGYYLVNTAGDVYAYGDAKSYGNVKSPTAAILGIATYPKGDGLWCAGADGSVYALGSAPNYGSVSAEQLTAPITSMAAFP